MNRKISDVPMTSAERVAARRARVNADGGKQIAVFLSAEATAKLELWLEKGESVTSIVNKLLKRSRP